MKKIFYIFFQCTWGILQTFAGFFLFLIYFREKHFFYHGAVVTQWKNGSSVSLGLFVFVSKRFEINKKKNPSCVESEVSSRLLVHEYGHTIQSILLGPFYIFAIGVPSLLWAGLPLFSKIRSKKVLSYFSFYTECWANCLGEKFTGQKSMENLIID